MILKDTIRKTFILGIEKTFRTPEGHIFKLFVAYFSGITGS